MNGEGQEAEGTGGEAEGEGEIETREEVDARSVHVGNVSGCSGLLHSTLVTISKEACAW